MQVRVQQDQNKIGQCGCGRSPTGKCIGWHGLSDEEYDIKKREWDLNEYRKQSNELWNDSCTSGKSE